MATDIRGTAVSTSDPQALALYEEALRQYQTYVGDPVATIERALAARPDFVLGHAFRAGVLMTASEQRVARGARASVEAAEALGPQANARERGLTAAARLLVDGDWAGACTVYDHVLVDEPRDVFAAQTAHLFDFYRGDAVNLRNRISRLLPDWDPGVPGYSYLLGMHAFGLEECNQYPEAEATARRALALEPHDGWAVHAGVHVMEMQGRIDDGIEWLESRVGEWAPDNGFAFHNFWHLALFYLDRDERDQVLRILDTHIYPGPSEMSLQLVDATALLFRLYLLGIDVGDRFARVARDWEVKLDAERGFYAFNDAHAMMALAVTGKDASAARLLRDMEETARGTGVNASMTREVGLPVARAVLALVSGRNDQAVAELAAVRDIAHHFGGSHAQRDLLTLTLIEAALRAGSGKVARHYLAERNVHRPRTGLGVRLAARAG